MSNKHDDIIKCVDESNSTIDFRYKDSFLIVEALKSGNFQFKLISLQGIEEDIKLLWNYFRTKYNVVSCFSDVYNSLNLGFEKIGSKYIYYPFGIVYRIDDLTDGSFYIGQTENIKKWNGGYTGSGKKWMSHLESHKDHKYKRTIIKNCRTPDEMFNTEVEEIRKYCYKNNEGIFLVDPNSRCKNIDTAIHGSDIYICVKCGEVGGHHKKSCVYYKKPKTRRACPLCGSASSVHKKECAYYKEPKKTKPCKYCGSMSVHKKECPKYKPPVKCSECGASYNKHRKGCSKYKPKICEECGKPVNNHDESCSKYGGARRCPDCGYLMKSHCHSKDCPQYVDPGKCKYCGYSIQSHYHHPSCPLYKKRKERKKNV